jgi:anti-sigma B factor antagonist
MSVRGAQAWAELTAPPRPPPSRHGEPTAACCCDLSIETGPAGNIVVVRVAGDIDMLTLPLVWTALITALERRPADLVVDVSEVRFCGARGFALLAAIARVTAAGRIGYAVTGLCGHLERAACLLWSDHHRACHHSLATAVAAIRDEQALRVACRYR